MSEIHIYGDGRSVPNPGAGSCGIVVVADDTDILFEDVIYEKLTTNNIMELQAAIMACDYANTHDGNIVYVTDSKYVQEGITVWINTWKRNKWRTAARKPVKNVEIWQKLDELYQQVKHRMTFQWVKGHADDKWNNYVDKLIAIGKPVVKAEPIEKEKQRFGVNEKDPAYVMFKNYYDKWCDETGAYSISRQMISNDNFMYILGMGSKAVPFILHELDNESQQNGRWIYMALHYITKANPIKKENVGKIGLMCQDWLEWGRNNIF